MKRNKHIFACVLLLLLIGFAFGQKEIPTTFAAQNENAFVEIKSKTEFPASFEFSDSGYKYRISSTGHGKRTGGNSSAINFDLGLDDGETLERAVYFAKYEGDVLLIAEYQVGDGSAGFITRLDGQTLRKKWKRPIPAFNVGQGLIDKNFVYVTGIGFVGKVNLDSGAYIWRHDNLYGQKDGTFNSFEVPKLEDNAVIFTESENYLRKRVASLTVDVRTGKILKANR